MPEQPAVGEFLRASAAMAAGEPEALLGFVTDDVEWWEIGATEPIHGLAAVKERMAELSGFEIAAEVHDVMATDEHLVALIHAKATRGGREFRYSTAEIYHLDENGRAWKRHAFAPDTKAIIDFFG